MPKQQQGNNMSETRSSQRFHSLNTEQVEVLDQVLSEVVPIHGRGNFPTLELRPRDIVIAVRARLLKQGISVRDVRLNGSTASHVLVRDNGTSYKDLDIIFGVELPRQEDFQVIKESVLGCLLDCLPAGVNRERISSATMKEAYVQKMVKVFTEQDRWSLISLSNNSGKNLELKFVSVLRRQFEFSVDSFQIILDPLLESYQKQEAHQVADCLENKDQASENQNKECLPLPAPDSTQKTETSSEKAHVSQATVNKDEIEDSREKEPQTEFSQQPEPQNQVEPLDQKKNETVPQQTECSHQEERSNRKEHAKPKELSEQKKPAEPNELSGQMEHSVQTEHSEQAEQFEQKEHSEESQVLEHEKPSEQEQILEQTDLSEQEELLQQVHRSDEPEPPDKAEVVDHKEPSDQIECSKQIEHSKQTELSDDMDQPNQKEHLNHKELANHKGLSNEMELLVQKELSQHTEPLVEQTELSEQTKQTEQPDPSQTEPVNLAERLHDKECPRDTEALDSSNEGQSHSEEHISHSVCVSDTDTHTHTEVEETAPSATEKTAKTETECETQTERKNDLEPTAEQISITEATDVEQTLNTDKSPSIASGVFPMHTSTPPTGAEQTPETHDAPHTENPENTPDTLDTGKPPTSQDKLSTQPSLISDKKTQPPPPGKAPSRLSQMVVLKHSSPKPPRRMCRKVAPNPNPNSVPEPEPVTVPSLDPDPSPSPSPEPEITTNPDPSPMSNPVANLMVDPCTDPTPSTTVVVPSKTDPSPSPDYNLAYESDLTSTPDPALDLSPDSALEPTAALPQDPPAPPPTAEPLPQIIIPKLTETLLIQMAYDTESHSEISSSVPEETASPFIQSEPPDSPNTLVSHTDTHHTQNCGSTHTSETELSDEEENRELQLKTTESDPPPVQQAAHSSPSPFPSDTPAVPCLTASPVLNLLPHPPCFAPSSPSLSPPPSLTPPSHCLTPPVLSVSPPPSYSSPPLSFSPTSSCLSSPPYLTPMLSLSPPPLCLSPPSPCLSPPLLCLTPPVESEESTPQVSSDPEPLIQNTQSEGQIIQSSPQPGVPLRHSQDKEGRDRISSLPQVPEPVSFPATVQSPGSGLLPHSQPGEKYSTAPPRAPEAVSSVSDNREASKVSTDTPEQYKTSRVSGTVPAVEVLAESMYGDFEAAMDHLRYRLIATRNPEEIRGGGLLKYSNLLVRDYRPASETQIKTLERYMCSRFFIDFPDVQEQQRKILSYLKNHFIGEERSKYQYLMTLRRVVDDSTVCLMGHERRQTLNMITVLALKVLGEQNIIPNTDHVTCFYQPAPYLAEHSAPYLAEPSYCSYYIPQGGSTLLYQPYPLHLHTQTGLV